jgi:hypothetical protein
VTGTTGTLTVNSDLTAGGHKYTFFAPIISVSGAKATNYTPLVAGAPPTLFYATVGGISIQGSGSVLTGDMFAPNGDVAMRGSGVMGGSGFIESQTLTIAGNFASYTGTGPLQGSSLTTVTTTDPSTTSTTFTTDPSTTTTFTDPSTVVPDSVSTGATFTATTGTNIGLGE